MLIGLMCFTPLNALLKVALPDATFGMLRFRLEMSLCIFGCGFGVLVLLCSAGTLAYDKAPVGERTPLDVEIESTAAAGTGAETGPCCIDGEPAASPSPPSTPSSGRLRGDGRRVVRLGLVLAALFLHVTMRDTLAVGWPLFLKRHFLWSEKHYGMVLPLQRTHPEDLQPRGSKAHSDCAPRLSSPPWWSDAHRRPSLPVYPLAV